MKSARGFKTIIFNLVAIGASWLSTKYDIDLPQDQQVAIATTIVAASNIALRLMTKTPPFISSDIGEKGEREQPGEGE